MIIFEVLILFAPLVLCRVIPDEDIIIRERLIDIYKLKQQSETLGKLNQTSLKINEDDISFYVYNREDPNGLHVYLQDASTLMTKTKFNPNLETVFIIHGWLSSYDGQINVLVRQALLTLRDINIIGVCWDSISFDLYLHCRSNVPYVGEHLGDFINNISTAYDYPLGNISIVGHSLGAHIAGIAGEKANGQLAAILGLDPAGPFFLESFKDGRLSQDDAKYVQAIHTDAQFLGVNYRLGHADFWPNGGWSQPGCGLEIGTCSHQRSYQYLAESVTYNDFFARECNSYNDYNEGSCSDNVMAEMGGSDIQSNIIGNYFLKTNSSFPYGLGDTSF